MMTAYPQMTAEERKAEYARLQKEFDALKAQGLSLNMARGKPGKAQLDLVSDIFELMQKPEDYVSDGIDVRNYGEMSGIPAAKRAASRSRCSWAATPASNSCTTPSPRPTPTACSTASGPGAGRRR